jgi:hypothetical protein
VTSIHDPYADLVDSDPSGTQHRVITALDHIYTSTSLPSVADDAVLTALHRVPVAPVPQRHRPRFRRSLPALVPASLLLLGAGIVASLRASSPASVSAQSILQRAAAVQLPPSSALHLVYRERYYHTFSPHAADDLIGRYDIWAEFDRHGKVTQSASTSVESTEGVTTDIERCAGGRRVEHCYRYEPASEILHRPFTVTATEAARDAGPLQSVDVLTGAGVPRLVTTLMHRSSGGVHLLPERRLNGVLVYPIRVDGRHPNRQPTMIYYFDAQTYILRGMTVLPPPGPGFADILVQHTVLIERRTVRLTAVPAGTFQLNPPRGKQVLVVIP